MERYLKGKSLPALSLSKLSICFVKEKISFFDFSSQLHGDSTGLLELINKNPYKLMVQQKGFETISPLQLRLIEMCFYFKLFSTFLSFVLVTADLCLEYCKNYEYVIIMEVLLVTNTL
jgi:hypothetical protein